MSGHGIATITRTRCRHDLVFADESGEYLHRDGLWRLVVNTAKDSQHGSPAALGTSRSWGLPMIFTSLVLGAILAYFAQFDLLVLMVIFGLVEFGTTVRTMQSGPCLALLNGQIYGPGEHEHFSSMVAPVVKGRTTDRQLEQRAQHFEHYAGLAAQTPMSAEQIAVTGLGYLVLCTCLLGLMWVLRDLSGAGNPLQLLH